MAKLDGLLKLKQHELDAKRKVLAEINERIANFENIKANILANIEKEKSAQINPIYAGEFGLFVERSMGEIELIDYQIEVLESEREEALDIVREAFLELKKIEITDESRKEREKKEQDKKQTALLDDIGLEQHRRKS